MGAPRNFRRACRRRWQRRCQADPRRRVREPAADEAGAGRPLDAPAPGGLRRARRTRRHP
eukprot:SM013426S26844  [mRNA]  locus=s13426:68:361:+ [translate_table: standard]